MTFPKQVLGQIGEGSCVYSFWYAHPKKWDDFVKRGEQVKDAADERVNDINFSYKFDMEEQRAKFRDVVDALRVFVTPSKA